MLNINEVKIAGNLGQNPTVKQFESGKKLAIISLATNETYKNKEGEKVTNTEWHNVVAWSNLAELLEKYTKKGSCIHVSGKLQTRSWDDQEGRTHYTTQIVANKILLVDKKAESTETVQPQVEADDLPF